MRIGLLALSCLMLASCAKPVSYYAAHAAERRARISACVETGDESQDCRNAKQAEYDALRIPAVNGRATP